MTGPARIDYQTGHIIFKVTSDAADGALGVYEMLLTANTRGPSPHIHHKMTETFYVLEGQVEIQHGETKTLLGVGETATAKPHDVHAFNNPTDSDTRFLIIFAPNNSREDYFTGLIEMLQRHPAADETELKAFMRSHDQYAPPSSS